MRDEQQRRQTHVTSLEFHSDRAEMLRHLYWQLHMYLELPIRSWKKPSQVIRAKGLSLWSSLEVRETEIFLTRWHGTSGQVSAPHFRAISEGKASCTPAASNATLNMIAYEGTRETTGFGELHTWVEILVFLLSLNLRTEHSSFHCQVVFSFIKQVNPHYAMLARELIDIWYYIVIITFR